MEDDHSAGHMNHQVELLSQEINNAVVQLPGRRFPGIVFQGDTLNNLYVLIDKVITLLQQNHLEDAADTAEVLRDRLAYCLLIYERVLKRDGIDLPYPGSIYDRYQFDEDEVD